MLYLGYLDLHLWRFGVSLHNDLLKWNTTVFPRVTFISSDGNLAPEGYDPVSSFSFQPLAKLADSTWRFRPGIKGLFLVKSPVLVPQVDLGDLD